MKKAFIIILIVIHLQSCTTGANKPESETTTSVYSDSSIRSLKKSYKDIGIEKEIIFNAPSDTGYVIVKTSGIRFIIHYYRNKPQQVLVQTDLEQDSARSHFISENNGIYASIKPESKNIQSVGFKYLKNLSGADLTISDQGAPDKLSFWEQYGSDGKTYDFKNVSNGMIKVYIMKDGEIKDSVLYIKK